MISAWVEPDKVDLRQRGDRDIRSIVASASPCPSYVPVLKITDRGWTTRGGLQWPARGPVYPDAFDDGAHGSGLYGFLCGFGDTDYVAGKVISDITPALVLMVKPWPMYGSAHKVKFPQARVAYRGSLGIAGAYIADLLRQHEEIYKPWIDYLRHSTAKCIYADVVNDTHAEAAVSLWGEEKKTTNEQYRREQLQLAEAERRRRRAERQAERAYWRNYVLVPRPTQDAILVDWPMPKYASRKEPDRN